ncbi:MAG: polyphosphate kinase 1 [Acidobacteriota bacterium]|mgnify:FL=1
MLLTQGPNPRAAAGVASAGGAGAVQPLPALDDPRLYVNRELSLLEFQRRVLEEALDESNPLLERLKFLAILDSNLDEFFMVRVAGLKQQLVVGNPETGPDGMGVTEQLEAIRAGVTELVAQAHECWERRLLPALAEAGVEILGYSALGEEQRDEVNRYFAETVFPVLTPLAFDPARPFPHISNLCLNLAVLVRDRGGVTHFAQVKVPETLPELVAVASPQAEPPAPHGRHCFVCLHQVIAANLPALFPGLEVLEAHPFHITRDADMDIQELEGGDLLEKIERGVRQRRFGDVVRLKVSPSMPARILELLTANLRVEESDVYRMSEPLALNRLMCLHGIDRPDLREAPFTPAVLPDLDISTRTEEVFAAVRLGDILLHHPFDSFQLVDFLRKAAHDPDVLAIKITLYRVGPDSPVVDALLRALENGKQVAVLVELKARFDEQSNIEWARMLERAGAHVVHGLVGLKVHAKAALVVRREGEHIRRYVHLSTGNYNPMHAHCYTDLGLFTCDPQIAADVSDLFNYLTGYSAKSEYRKLLVAPMNLKARLGELIEREIEHQRRGQRGHLIFKLNALVDEKMIRLLYRASQSGMQVDLLVRGMCCLRPGLEGVSDNIRVTSIVGRFLEHSRLYYFRNGGAEEVYTGSSDLMPRNLKRRVELLCPVEDPRLLRYLRDEVLVTYLADNVQARHMRGDGSYERAVPRPGEGLIDAQAWFIDRAMGVRNEPAAPLLRRQDR